MRHAPPPDESVPSPDDLDQQLKATPKNMALVRHEIDRLASANDEGTVHPQDLVDAARADGSPIHHLFQWDDSAAAEAFRRAQARRWIQLVIVVHERKPERMWVSIEEDRRAGGGYRRLQVVLNDAEMRPQYVKDAKRELTHWIDKYGHVAECRAFALAQLQRLAAEPEPPPPQRGRRRRGK